jgi:hypothetical protein
MNAWEHNQELASEVARRREAPAQHRQHLNRLLGIGLLVGVAVGLTVWFWQPAADRDSTHFGFALGLAAGAYFACGMLGRGLCPKPQATCPRCGCDWEAESDNNSQTWLAWSVCPGCGLQMTEDSGKRRVGPALFRYPNSRADG